MLSTIHLPIAGPGKDRLGEDGACEQDVHGRKPDHVMTGSSRSAGHDAGDNARVPDPWRARCGCSLSDRTSKHGPKRSGRDDNGERDRPEHV